MRIRQALRFVFGIALVVFPCGALGQSASPARPESAAQLPPVISSSDAQAQSLLSDALNAAGGLQVLSSLQDFTGSGEITYSWAGQQVQSSVTLRGRGIDQFRLDAVLPDGTRSWSVSHGSGRLIKPDGTTESVPGHNAINLGSITFPYLWLAGVSADSLTTVSSVGNAQVNGANAVEIRVQRHYTSSFDPNGTIAQLTTRDFFIDPASSLILKVEFMTHPLKTFSVSLPEDIYFSDYQRVNGVMVPFSIVETVNGQQIWSIQISSIHFNSGLTDADFAL